ncbi:MAG: hypothetical protein KBB11_09735 [Bacteroidales bacterium]|nr:hypothetical protein [Bacteroidales bacterium]HQP04607.1 hypothetical protein [Bacteroidales bacterium]
MKKYLSDGIIYLIFGILFFCTHWLISYFLLGYTSPKGFYTYHIFLFFLTLINIICILWLFKKNITIMGYGFMLLGFVKMLLSIIFLLPVLLHKNSATTGYVIQFLVVYVFYLVYEVIYVVRILKN